MEKNIRKRGEGGRRGFAVKSREARKALNQDSKKKSDSPGEEGRL